MLIIQNIAVWALIALLAATSWTAIQHNHRRKQRDRRRQRILRNRL